MSPWTYRLEMERRFNAVMIPILSAFFGIMAVTILSVRFGLDPKMVFAVSFLCALAVSLGMMVWWNVSVLSKMRELEKNGRFH